VDLYTLSPFRDTAEVRLGPIELLKGDYFAKCSSGGAVLEPDNKMDCLTP
jgi:hypothetical protein